VSSSNHWIRPQLALMDISRVARGRRDGHPGEDGTCGTDRVVRPLHGSQIDFRRLSMYIGIGALALVLLIVLLVILL
jgi:hypothetical protein